jgi:hypothetical protein
LQNVGIGLKIGNINVNNTGCADDIALLSTRLSDEQIMINMALDFANLEGYELQPKKSVAIHIRGNNKQCETTNEKLNMGNITKVEQATHLGIIRTTTMKHNIQTNVDENITKQDVVHTVYSYVDFMDTTAWIPSPYYTSTKPT